MRAPTDPDKFFMKNDWEPKNPEKFVKWLEKKLGIKPSKKEQKSPQFEIPTGMLSKNT